MIDTIQHAARGYDGVALSLALGLLVGVQRGWAQRAAADGSRFAGIRTFGLLGLAGGIAGHLSGGAQLVAAVILTSTAALILVSYWRTTQAGSLISGTASVAGLIVLACGFMAATGAYLPATAITVVMVLLLTMRERLHRLVEGMSEIEVIALARFALIAVVILPLLPDRPYGPYDAWNPRELWLVVVLVCAVSLAGYIAARLLGPSRATLATAAAGAMVSSTAVTVSLATRLKAGVEGQDVLHGGIALASVVMFARVLILTGLLAPFALPALATLVAPGLATSVLGSAWFLWRARMAPRASGSGATLRNPFDIGPALFLMALVMAMSLAARWLESLYGDSGLATALALAGMVDVDSAIITMGGLPKDALHPSIAGLVLLPPILLNSLFKAGSAIAIAGWRRAWPGALVLAVSAVACLTTLPLVL